MKRPDQTAFRLEPLAALARQLLFAPPEKRIEQVRRTEQLHDQIDPQVNYPFDFISYRVTGYQTEQIEPTLLVGSELQPDLRVMIDRLSRSVGMPIDPDEPIETIQELSSRLSVSSKTIERYRRLGLRWRWVRGSADRRKFIAFTPEAVEHFLARHQSRVQRAARFTKIPAEDRHKLVESAAALAAGGDLSLNQVATRIARESGRALETIRLLLEHHEQSGSQQLIFPQRTRQLSGRDKQLIARALRRGVSAGRLAAHFGRKTATIYRAAREYRASCLRRLDIRHVASDQFTAEDADEVIAPLDIETDAAAPLARDGANRVDDLPAALGEVFGRGGMAPALVKRVFVRMNYMKHKAVSLRERLDRYDPRVGDLEQIEGWLDCSRKLRRRLVEANLHVVLSVARRHLIDDPDQTVARIAELLGIGNTVLLEAIETFEFAERQTFDAYLRWRLMRRFAALPTTAGKAHRRLNDQQMIDMIVATLAELGICSTSPPA